MAYYEFPHTRNYDTDLGYLIKETQKNSESIDNINNTIESLDIENIDTKLDKLESSDTKQNEDINNINQNVNALEKDNTKNKSDIKDLQVDNETNELNIANNAARLSALEGKDFLTLVKFLDSATITFIDQGKQNGVQTFQAIVSGSVPANLTDNLEYANNNVSSLLSGLGNANIDDSDSNLKVNAEFKIINNGTLSTVNYTILNADKTFFIKNAQGLLSFNTNVFDDINAKIELKQDKLVSGTNIKTINGQAILGKGNINTPKTEIINNLTSTATDKGLAANQGKVLNEKIQATNTDLSGTKSQVEIIASNYIGQGLDAVGTLTAGATSLQLTISSVSSLANALIDVYTSVYGVNPTAISVSGNVATLTFDAQTSEIKVGIKLMGVY